MKSAIQLKALIGNMAKEKGLQHEILLRHYMHERFLKRVSKSKYSHQFVLKGGLLIADMIGINARSTKDLDATIKGFSLTEENLKTWPYIGTGINKPTITQQALSGIRC